MNPDVNPGANPGADPGRDTSTVLAARGDARARAGTAAEWMPYLPAAGSPFAPDGVDPADLTWAETVAPGGYTSKVAGPRHPAAPHRRHR